LELVGEGKIGRALFDFLSFNGDHRLLVFGIPVYVLSISNSDNEKSGLERNLFFDCDGDSNSQIEFCFPTKIIPSPVDAAEEGNFDSFSEIFSFDLLDLFSLNISESHSLRGDSLIIVFF